MRSKLTRCLALSLIVVWSLAAGGPQQKKAAFDGQAAYDYVKVLASDAMEGRESGEPGERMAADYIVSKFKEWGVEPAGANAGYFQDFTIEYHDVAPLRRPKDVVLGVVPGIVERQEIEESKVYLEVGRLAYEEVLSAMKRPLHALPFHPEVLHRRPHRQEDEQGEDNRLYDVARGPPYLYAQPRSPFDGDRGSVSCGGPGREAGGRARVRRPHELHVGLALHGGERWSGLLSFVALRRPRVGGETLVGIGFHNLLAIITCCISL